ncbi:uncharacterized protein [Arachis hypogaea]|uniref:uncharacterized protein n=1 Tax=Arachis hypogaea TaxID=3818 RepID=UPI003B21645A
MNLSEHHKSIKAWAEINGRRVCILIDCGASDNFVTPEIVTELGQRIDNTPKFQVRVANSSNKGGQGRCLGVTLQFKEVAIKEDFFIFPTDEAKFVLGLAWLDKLGDVIANFKKLCLRFRNGDSMVTLQGDQELCYGGMHLQSAVLSIQEGGEGFMVQLWPMSMQTATLSQVLLVIESVLDFYAKVFQTLPGLPPHGRHDHAIPLSEGALVPNIRPYRYPHHQKSVIEQMVREMLASGIIRTSSSPYASPILLVKKKDSNWRFCVDYRALNRITVLDKFPITVIDELLDELAGAAVFSKLDLKLSQDMASHALHLQQVFQILMENQLVLNEKKCYEVIAKPLKELTKQNAFEWNDKAQETFESVKRLIADLPTLAVSDFNQDFVVELMHRVRGWFLTDQRLMDSAYLKWTTKLLGLDFEIRYRPSLENKAADALSRQIMAREISMVHMNLWETVEEEVYD